MNKIRVDQINQSDFAEFISDTVSSGDFFYRLDNPSGFLTATEATISFLSIESGIALQSEISSLSGVHKFASYIGDGTNTGISVSHNLGTRDVFVSIYETGHNYQMVEDDGNDLSLMSTTYSAQIYATGVNSLLVGFNSPPPLNSFRIVIIG